MRKCIAVFLALIAIMSLIACEKTESTHTNGADIKAQRTVDDGGLPELDFNGASINIVGRPVLMVDLSRDTITNNILNDAIYIMIKYFEADIHVILSPEK